MATHIRSATGASQRLLTIQSHISPVFGNNGMVLYRTATSDAAQKVLDTRRSMKVFDSDMSFLDTGPKNAERVVLFLHGNPSAAYLWRNIIPHVQAIGTRCIAPDLIGMGHSAKLENDWYKYATHYRYLSKWIEQMELPEKINLVVHDWGSGLGFNWCYQHQNRVKSITHMESLVSPAKDWSVFPEVAKNAFQAMRSPGGEEIVLKKNFFVEKLLPGSIMRKLSKEEMDEYRRPYLDEGESRRPTLTWPREIPIESDGPLDVVNITKAYAKWLRESGSVPKLTILGKPGFFSSDIEMDTKDWPNNRTRTVKGLHFLQEDSPDDIGAAIAEFLNDIYAGKAA
ncbi:unnamed protein product [Owenia fusiformis]|uniref:AB hydrolase-1 domain-containing protein n=1 Tax=Owenia fusiformis TaxID=6347 RepID=A0A8S4Q2U8_OWEFU|nr:unnamed protein product [Owenia fusiformis]